MYLLESNNRILLKMERGEEIVSTLQDFAEQRQIPHGIISGIGAVENLELGAYELEERIYVRKQYPGHYELLNMTANMSWVDGSAFLHAHVMLGDDECHVIGGHLFKGHVYATLELVFWPGQNMLSRADDSEIGLKLWDLPHKIEDFGF